MVSRNFTCVFVIFVICFYTKSVCDSLGNADPTGNSITESKASDEILDNVPNITPYLLPNSLEDEHNKHPKKSLNTNNDGLTADQQTVINIVEKQLNSILRGKRQKCELPPTMIQDFTRIYQQLNSSVFYGTSQDESPRVKIPHIQLQTCPADRFDLPLESTLNSLAVCPWRVIETDLGVNAFPRYMHDIYCVCQSCVGALYMSCTENRHTHEYLEFKGCENGFAVFVRKYEMTGYNCFCRSASFQVLIPNKNLE